MPASQQTAIRVGDAILHSEANEWGGFGFVEGALVGLAVGVLVVSTGGLAGVALVAGATLIGGSLGGKLGEIYGKHQTNGQGQVLSGSPNVIVGFDKQPAARADADVAHCEQHSGSDAAHDQPSVQGKKIAQGSATVLINGFYAARKGDKGVCDFTLGDGWPSVFIGGPAKTADGLTITSETGALDTLILGAGIVGGLLLAAPAAAAMIGEGIAAGSGWAAISGQVVTRLGGQLLLGMGLSKAGGAGLYYVGGLVFGQGSLGQDLSQFVGENAAPLAGMIKLPGVGESGYGLMDGLPDTLGFGSEAEGVPALPPGESALPGEDTPQRYGGTGADPELTSSAAEQARANAAYDQIRSNPDDVAQIAQNTGQSPDTIQTVKDHLFNSQHDIIDPDTGEVTQSNFTPDEGTASLWNKAADGSLGQPRMSNWGTPIDGSANPEEVTQFNQLVAHEYVESQMVADGYPYQARGSWTQNPDGGWDYNPNPSNYGAHDLSPNFTDNPFSHYEKVTGLSPDGIPRPNADNSNLDDVVAGIRRALAEDGGAGGKGPGGGMGTGARPGVPSGRAPPPAEAFVPPKPLPAAEAEGIPATPAAEAAPLTLPDALPNAEAGSGSGEGAAAETEAAPAAPEPAHEPQAARTEPEPVPAAEATDPANVQDGPSKQPTLRERIKANRNLKTKLNIKPAQSTQVPYGGDNLSQKAIEFRQNWIHPKTGKVGYWGEGNVAVYEYQDGESLQTLAVKSIPRTAGDAGLHSEPAGLLELEQKGVSVDQITQVYTEREPCMSAGNYCGTLLGSELPGVPVTHSFEYGASASSQDAGNAALRAALQRIQGK